MTEGFISPLSGPESGEEAGQEISLTTNPVLNEIVKDFTSRKPDWNRVLAVVTKQNIRDPGQLLGRLSETWLEIFLQDKSQELGDKLTIKPILNRTKTANFVFNTAGKHNIVISSKQTKQNLVELDNFIICTDEAGQQLPVVWDIKLKMKRGKTPTKDGERPWKARYGRSPGERSRSTFEALHPERIQKIFTPLLELYSGSKFGYVAILSQEIIRSQPTLENFKTIGGIVIPFPANREEMETIKSKAGLEYKMVNSKTNPNT